MTESNLLVKLTIGWTNCPFWYMLIESKWCLSFGQLSYVKTIFFCSPLTQELPPFLSLNNSHNLKVEIEEHYKIILLGENGQCLRIMDAFLWLIEGC